MLPPTPNPGLGALKDASNLGLFSVLLNRQCLVDQIPRSWSSRTGSPVFFVSTHVLLAAT